MAAFYGRLVAAGKAKMAAVGACLRKLLMIAHGVLKGRTAFDPARASKMTPWQLTTWFGGLRPTLPDGGPIIVIFCPLATE